MRIKLCQRYLCSSLLIAIFVVKSLAGDDDSQQWKCEGHRDLHAPISPFRRTPHSQTDLCAETDEGHLGWVMWAESGRAVVSPCPPAETSVYLETLVQIH